MQGWIATIVGLVLGCFASTAGWAQVEKRVALVIGNAAYKEAPLKNSVNDARAMAARLQQLGFEVIARENLTKGGMESAIGDFGEKLSQGAVGMLFYAGHGIQLGGRNYMIPIDARLIAEQRVKLETVDVEAVLDQMAAANTRVSLVVLDACRVNPFERRWRNGNGNGLAQMNAPSGTLIAYATAPGATATDGDGANGVYTAALLKALVEPGLKAEEVFKRVRIEVTAATKNQQTPWEASSLTGDFVFNAAANTNASTTVSADREALFWQSAKESNRSEEYEAYLKQYPDGAFAPLARARMLALEAASKELPLAVSPAPSSLPQKSEVAIEPIEGDYVANASARLREAPDVKSKQVALLKPGDAVPVLGKVIGQPWYQVSRKRDIPAYISAELVEDSAAFKKRQETEQQRPQLPVPTAGSLRDSKPTTALVQPSARKSGELTADDLNKSELANRRTQAEEQTEPSLPAIRPEPAATNQSAGAGAISTPQVGAQLTAEQVAKLSENLAECTKLTSSSGTQNPFVAMICGLVQHRLLYMQTDYQYRSDPRKRAEILKQCNERMREQPDLSGLSAGDVASRCEVLGPRFPVLVQLGAYPTLAEREAKIDACRREARSDPSYRAGQDYDVQQRCAGRINATDQRARDPASNAHVFAAAQPASAVDQAKPSSERAKELLQQLLKGKQ